MYFIFMNSFFCFTLIFMLQNIGLGLVCDIDLSEIEFLISNFLCQNVQTTVGGGESESSLSIQTFCVHTCWGKGGGSLEL